MARAACSALLLTMLYNPQTHRTWQTLANTTMGAEPPERLRLTLALVLLRPIGHLWANARDADATSL
eukprot:458689-Lingulodinium_polyedra.AAC.1